MILPRKRYLEGMMRRSAKSADLQFVRTPPQRWRCTWDDTWHALGMTLGVIDGSTDRATVAKIHGVNDGGS